MGEDTLKGEKETSGKSRCVVNYSSKLDIKNSPHIFNSMTGRDIIGGRTKRRSGKSNQKQEQKDEIADEMDHKEMLRVGLATTSKDIETSSKRCKKS